MTSHLSILILAAGKGTRMKSTIPKCMQEVGGLALIGHIIKAVKSLSPSRIGVVVSENNKKDIHAFLGESVTYILQNSLLGSGHAAMCALDWIKQSPGQTLIVCGDVPFIQNDTLMRLQETPGAIKILAMRENSPKPYGRLIEDNRGFIKEIVEAKDSREEASLLCYSGAMMVENAVLQEIVPSIPPSPVSGEYYLTRLVDLAYKKGFEAGFCESMPEECLGVNTPEELVQAQNVFQKRIRFDALNRGVIMTLPDTVVFSHDSDIAHKVTIDPYVVFGPGVRVEEGATIKSFSYLEGAHVGKNCVVGPFARLRPEAVLEEESRVGNFVEVKASVIGKKSKVNHLSYVGNTTVGKSVNIGAGTITCNYDGHKKHETVIEDGAFIGSNTALVAPVRVGEKALVAAGSVVTKDVPANTLVIARSRQSHLQKKD